MSNIFSNLSAKALQQAAKIQEKIESFQERLHDILGGQVSASVTFTPPKRKMSASGRRKIAQAQKLRWAKAKGEQVEKPAKKRRRKMSAAAKAKISAAAKLRWQKVKASGKRSL